jgi:hypothetical protein
MLQMNTRSRVAVGKGMTATSEGADKPRIVLSRLQHARTAKGHSLKRQTEAAEAWCAARRVELDRELTLEDLGAPRAQCRGRDARRFPACGGRWAHAAREYSEDILDNDPFAKIEQQRWALATTG